MTSPVALSPAMQDNSRLNLPTVSNNFSPPSRTLARAADSQLHADETHPATRAVDPKSHTEEAISAARAADLKRHTSADGTGNPPQGQIEGGLPSDTRASEGNLQMATVAEHGRIEDRALIMGNRATYANIIKPAAQRKPDVMIHRCAILRSETNNREISLKILEAMYHDRVTVFQQHALIGRLLLRKGEKPLLTQDLKKELQTLWQAKSEWQLIPMSKGFYTIKFSTTADKIAAKNHNAWSINSGTLRLREWVRNFDPYKEISSICQVWLRIYYLPVEYWTKEIISSIGGSVGVPIKMDGATADGDVGHFAKVLVEVDLASPLPESLAIDCPDRSFYVEFGYEQLSLFCTKCKITGHNLEKCNKRSHKSIEEIEMEPNPANEPPAADSREETGIAAGMEETRQLQADSSAEVPCSPVSKTVDIIRLEQEMKVQRAITLAASINKDIPTTKPRGRPPGQRKTDRKQPLADDSIKTRLRRPPESKAEPNPESMERIKAELYKAWEAGGNPRNFVISNDGSSSSKMMSKVATKSWADEVERGDALPTTH